MDRFLALLLGLRNEKNYNFEALICNKLAAVWVSSNVAAFCYILDYGIIFGYGYVVVLNFLILSIVSDTKISTLFKLRSSSITVEPNNFTEHGTIQRGSVQWHCGCS